MSTEADPSTEPAPPEPSGDRSALAQALKDVGPVVQVMLLASVTVPALVGFFVIGKAIISGDELRAWAERVGWPAGLLFALGLALSTGNAVAPTYALAAAGGIVFGTWLGGGLAVGGVVGGALIGYAWGAWLARSRVTSVIDAHPRAGLIRRALVDRGLPDETLVVGMLRFPPNSPFALTNLVMSSTGVRLAPFAIGTAVGMAPRTLFAAWLGHETGNITDAIAKGKWSLAVGVVLMLVFVYVLYRQVSTRVNRSLRSRLGDPSHDPNAEGPKTGSAGSRHRSEGPGGR